LIACHIFEFVRILSLGIVRLSSMLLEASNKEIASYEKEICRLDLNLTSRSHGRASRSK
jgi:hypothetical protein